MCTRFFTHPDSPKNDVPVASAEHGAHADEELSFEAWRASLQEEAVMYSPSGNAMTRNRHISILSILLSTRVWFFLFFFSSLMPV